MKNRVKKTFADTYRYFLTLPDRLYPFKSEIEGEWVRGRRSYELALRQAVERYGFGREGYKIAFYRDIFHFLGSILFITFATLVSNDLFGSETALYVLFFAAIIALSYQEFYFHPKRMGQHPGKSVVDWLVWVVPMVLYLVLFK